MFGEIKNNSLTMTLERFKKENNLDNVEIISITTRGHETVKKFYIKINDKNVSIVTERRIESDNYSPLLRYRTGMEKEKVANLIFKRYFGVHLSLQFESKNIYDIEFEEYSDALEYLFDKNTGKLIKT